MTLNTIPLVFLFIFSSCYEIKMDMAKKATVPGYSVKGIVTTFAGDYNNSGSVDGPYGVNRWELGIGGIAVKKSTGEIFVCDSYNRVIRKISANGNVETVVGSVGVIGSADGQGTSASFGFITDIAFDSQENIFVVDYVQRNIRKIDTDYNVTTFAGTAGVDGYEDNSGLLAKFHLPYGIAIDSNDMVYIADKNAVIRKITPAGVVSTLAGTNGVHGRLDGLGLAAQFLNPSKIAIDKDLNLYVSDGAIIRKITQSGLVTTYAGAINGDDGSTNGHRLTQALFNNISGLVFGLDGALYITEQDNPTVRKIGTDGIVSTIAGLQGFTGNVDGLGTEARFDFNNAIGIDQNGFLFISEDQGVIRKVK